MTFSRQISETVFMDKMIHATAADGTVRILSAVTTEIVREAVRRHQTSPTVSAALGRVLTGTLLLGSSFKDFDRLTVKIESNGTVEGITAEATAHGTVRGYVKNSLADLPPRTDGKFDVAGIVGDGMFYVIREIGYDVGSYVEPYIGTVPLISGEIAEDFANYLMKSEQIPSAVLLGVLLQKEEPFVTCAGGVMVQMMPGADENIAVMIEDTILHAPQLTEAIKEGATAQDLIEMVLGIIPFEILEEKDVNFQCNCSFDRAVQLISSLGRTEVESMLAEDQGASMTCGFCGEIYTLDENDLREMLDSMEK